VKTVETECKKPIDDVNSIAGCIIDIEGVVTAVEDIMN